MTIRADDAIPRGTRAALRWHASHTIGADALPPLDELLAIKRGSGIRISAIVTAADDTPPGRVRGFVERLTPRRRLVDELLVVPSGPEPVVFDDVRSVPAAAIMPEVPATTGRGDAMWRGLAATSGDVVVWLDAEGSTPASLEQLAGALLVREDLAVVAGASTDMGERAVTELLVRPLLTMLFPEMAAFETPACRSIAGRRSTLEGLPFFTDDGAEIGLILDAFHTSGLACVGQVRLEPAGLAGAPPAETLSGRAHAIAHAILRRAEEGGRVRAAIDYPSHPLLVPGGGGLTAKLQRQVERPPIEVVPTYLAALRSQDAIAAAH